MNTNGHSVLARILVSVAVVGLSAALLLRGGQTAPPANPEIPRSDTIQPDELVKAIASKDKPIIVCVAPRFLYDGAHIALQGPDLVPVLKSTNALHEALAWGIEMIREEILALMQ